MAAPDDGVVPHFVQVGDGPVLTGPGTDDLVCACGESVLVRGVRATSLLSIAISCARCGAVTATPGLPPGEMLPPGVRVIERERRPVPTPFVLGAETILADRDELIRIDELTKPRKPASETMPVTAGTLDAVEADYDRLSGGRLAAHRATLPPDGFDLANGLPKLPLVWALGQVRAGLERPGWWCLDQEPDAVAANIIAAFREFVSVWSGHPLFEAMAASAAADGFSTHGLAAFAAARAMSEAGNRVVFNRQPPGQATIDEFAIELSPTERLAVLVRRFDAFDWPRGTGREGAAARARAIDALIASQGRINLRRPGVLVLSVGPVHRQVDPMIIQGLAEAVDGRWRRQRGLVGVALVLPKIYATTRSDLVTFGWIFLPTANPSHPNAVMRAGPSPPGMAMQ